MKIYDIPLLIRGEIIADNLVDFEGRRGELTFRTPDVTKYLDRLPLTDPTRMADMYEALSFDDVVDYLDQLGKRLSPKINSYMQEAYELSCITSGLGAEILFNQYCEIIPALFRRRGFAK